MVNKQDAYKLNVAENVRWISGYRERKDLKWGNWLKDRIPIDEKMRKGRIIWFGHV